MSARRLHFPIALLAPVVVSSGAALLVPGLAPFARVALAVGFVVRVVLLRLHREPSPSRGWFALSVSTPTVATAWIAFEAHANHAAGPALVSVACAMLGLSLVSPPTPAALSRLVGLSLAQIAGAAVLVEGRDASVACALVCVAYVAVLVPVMLRLASVLFAPRRSDAVTWVRRVVATGADRRSSVPGAARLLVAALPLGLWLFVALPHRSNGNGLLAAAPTPAGNDDEGPAAPRAAAESAASESALSSFVSGGKTGVRLGFVARVRKNQKPVLLVTLDGGVRGAEPLTLRGMTYDVFAESAWLRSSASTRLSSAAPDDDGWVAIAPSTRPARRHDLVIEDVSGDGKPGLFLAPDAIRVRLDPRAADRRVAAAPDGVVFALGAMPSDGRYREEAEFPPERGAAGGRRSDASVAPDPRLAEAPPEAARYREIARRVVGDRTSAADRADRIERWLRTEFAYTTDMPAVSRTRPVLDFLERIRRGHCEYFASSMALMLRSLGHATRLAVGFRGGDYLETLGRWSFRGNHAHAWCEVFYEGLGWIAYDPTPPLDAGADRTTGAAGEASDDDGLVGRLIRFSVDDRRRLVADATRLWNGVATFVADEASRGRWPFVAAGVAALVLLVRRRRARGRARALGAVDGAGRALGPYGTALAALSHAGISRGESEAGGEFARRVARARPAGADAFDRLTSLHESARFGTRAPTPADLSAAADALSSLCAALEPRPPVGTAPAPGRAVRSTLAG